VIIVKLLVSGKVQGDEVATSMLKNKFTLEVFGSAFDSYHLNALDTTELTNVYVIQFITKSILFTEIEATLRSEFPQTDFNICATPVVHMAIHLHNKIKKRVIGLNFNGKETEF